MLQIALLVICLVIFLIYFKGRATKKQVQSEVDIQIESYRKEIMRFLKEIKQGLTQTKRRRLQIEAERLKKATQLDRILEKAERESNPKKAIDYYLEAFSFINKNNFELERKSEIENKIKALQERMEPKIPSQKR